MSNRRRKPATSKALSAIAQNAMYEPQIRELNEIDLKHLKGLPDNDSRMVYLEERIRKNRESIAACEKQNDYNPLGLGRLLKERERFLQGLTSTCKISQEPFPIGYMNEISGNNDAPSATLMKKHIFYYLENYRRIYNALEKCIYIKRMERIRSNKKKKLDELGTIRDQSSAHYNKLGKKYGKFGWDMYHYVKEKISKKDMTFDMAVEEYTLGDSHEIRREKVKKMAIILAYNRFDIFLLNEVKRVEDRYTPSRLLNSLPVQNDIHINKPLSEHSEEKTELDKKFDIPVKAYSPKELHGLYGVTAKTFNSWVTPHSKTVGILKGRKYTPAQVRRIFSIIGTPDTKTNK